MLEVINNISYVIGVPDQSEIVNLLFPNVWVLLSHIIAGIILIVIVTILVWKPTKKYLKNKKLSYQKEMLEAEQKNKEAAINFENSKTSILESKNLASIIINDATSEAQKIKISTEKIAHENAENYKKNVEISIRNQQKEMHESFDLEVSKLAMETAKKFLSNEIDLDKNEKIMKDIISELKNN